jgi:hypothetical protein
LAPNLNVPPRSRTPGRSVIIGIPLMVPLTSISVACDCSAAIKSAALVTTFTVGLNSLFPIRVTGR